MAAVGLSAIGTLAAALTAGVRARGALLTVLVLPLLVPLLDRRRSVFDSAVGRGSVESDGLVAIVHGDIRCALRGGGIRALRLRGGGMKRRTVTVWGVLAGVAMVVAAVAALGLAPREATMGDVQRLFYFHMPSAWIALGPAFTCVFGFSVAYLVTGRMATTTGWQAPPLRSGCSSPPSPWSQAPSGRSRPGASSGLGSRGLPPLSSSGSSTSGTCSCAP